VTFEWPLRVIQGQGHCGFWILGTKVPILFLSNYGSISHRLGATCDYSYLWPLTFSELFKVTRGQRSRCPSTDHCMVNILSIGTHRLRAMVYPLWAILTFVTLKLPWRSSKVKGHDRTLTKPAIRNIFVIGTYGLRATVWPLRATFSFVTLKWPLEVVQGQGHCGFWILGTKFILVFLSNYGYLSRLGATGDYSYVWPLTFSELFRSLKVKGQDVLRQTRTCWTFLSIGTHRLQAMVYPLWAILTFVTLKWPWKVIRGQRSWCILTKSPWWTFFVIDTYGLRATVCPLRAIFTFVTLRWPLKGHPSQGHCGFWILGTKFLLVFLSNYGSIVTDSVL